MTFSDLIKDTYGKNPQTDTLISHIADNLMDMISAVATIYTDDDIKILKAGLSEGNTENGMKALGEIVNYTLNGFDILTLPSDGKTPFLTKICRAAVSILKANINMLAPAPVEPTSVPEPVVEAEDPAPEKPKRRKVHEI